jgi:hypothetical protein
MLFSSLRFVLQNALVSARNEANILEFPYAWTWWQKEDDPDAALCWSGLRSY